MTDGLKPLGDAHLAELSAPGVPSFLMDLASSGLLSTEDAPLWSCKPTQYVARYGSVAHLMKCGDASWFGGVMPWSLAIRCGEHSMVSHGGLLGKHNEHIWNVDTCEGVGCRERRFSELVQAEHNQTWRHGCWYWGPVGESFKGTFDGGTAFSKAQSYVGAPYGHLAILFVAASLMPVAREILFLRNARKIETDWPADRTPYCSALQSIAASAGGVDPCPGLAWQLTSPQDTWQSLLWPIKVKLIA